MPMPTDADCCVPALSPAATEPTQLVVAHDDGYMALATATATAMTMAIALPGLTRPDSANCMHPTPVANRRLASQGYTTTSHVSRRTISPV